MNDPKSTTEVRLIAQDVTEQQAEVCAAKRENLEDKLTTLATSVSANTSSIATLTAMIATMATNLAVLKVRLAIWAAIGGSLPVIIVLAGWWYSSR